MIAALNGKKVGIAAVPLLSYAIAGINAPP
jgi:hypothetical protein